MDWRQQGGDYSTQTLQKVDRDKVRRRAGLDRWATPFEVWCAVTRTYEKPFEDNKYTIAGKIIEPKVIEYLKKLYFGGSLKSPTDVYARTTFKNLGDFFPDVEIFGGMWMH